MLYTKYKRNSSKIHVSCSVTRQRTQSTDLLALNAHLSNQAPWEVRLRAESLKRHRKAWEQIFTLVTQHDVKATTQYFQDCERKVREALSEESCDRRSIMDLRQDLTQLQVDLAEANDLMNKTEARLEFNVRRIDELKHEAVELDLKVLKPSNSSNKNKFSNESKPDSVNSAIKPYNKTTSTRTRKNRGLESSLNIESYLKEFWYPVEFSSTLEADTLVPLELFDEPWVLFRRKDGRPTCIRDSCAHRACPLSLGKVENGEVSCAYHGWNFNGDGECTVMPSTVFIRGMGVEVLPCVEVDGLIWVYPGTKTPPEQVPSKITEPPQSFDIHAELLLEVPVEHGLLIENLLDLAHAPFTHTSTFAKGWPVPDLVAFKTVEMLGGHWHPYPIDMSFAPPCMTLSTIGLSQPGKIERGQRQEDCRNHLHQLHVCLPAGKGRTRLLYRMSLDFISWARDLPFMDRLWKRVADQVLNEDLRLVLGQQANLVREGPKATWSNPVPYDKLAVRYRRWRNNLDRQLEADHEELDEKENKTSRETDSIPIEEVSNDEELVI